MKALVRLMTVPTEKRDLAWIKESLQAAIQLEFSTIPPYLYAAWSIDPAGDPDQRAGVISEIAEEEMLHMGIACNALAAVGGAPDIVGFVPTYPTTLPMNVHEGLTVDLAPLSADVLLTTFMAIEEPEVQFAEDPDFHPSGTVLIGQFYDALWDAIREANPTLSVSGQVKLNFHGQNWIMETLDQIKDGIDLIKRQGEGSAAGPFENKDDPNELAHFYQFGEIFHGRELTRAKPYTYTGDPVRMPTARDAAPAPASLPDAVAFDQKFSGVVRLLHSAWNGGGDGPFGNAVNEMFALPTLAATLFGKGVGPGFRLVDPPVEPPPPPPPAGRYSQVLGILDAAVGQAPFGAHGPFWRGLTRDEFVGHAVFGQQLVVVGDGSGSNLVKALRGQAPFGSDTGTTGAPFRRMPAGRPPVPGASIDVVQKWIDDGCPADVVAEEDTEVSLSTGGFRPPESVHVEYFRELDDWSLINRPAGVDAAVGRAFTAFGAWVAHVRDPANDQAWIDMISTPEVTDALRLLSTLQRRTVEHHYGVPVPLLAVLDGYERFGNDGLPDDPLRPSDPRHTMNGASMWFVYASFADACVHLGIAPNFWRFMLRAILCGLCNDGLFRGRFPVQGFTPDAAGRQAVFEHAQQVTDADLATEIGQRYLDSGL